MNDRTRGGEESAGRPGSRPGGVAQLSATMGLARLSLSSAAALLMALVTLAPAALGEGLSQRDRSRLRFEIEQHLDERHLRRDAVDLEPILGEVDRALDAGAPRRDVRRLAAEALLRSLNDFAPRGAQPRPSFKYRYPLDVRAPRLITQGPGEEYSHENAHAFDFAIEIGTRVLAARPGRVVRVIDGFTEKAQPKEFSWKANVVTILHQDGTFAFYVHLSPGIRVREGQEVKGGEWIANSGHSGYSGTPHLHFEVSRLDEAGTIRSVPIRFRNGTPEGRIPERLEWVMGRPAATVRLRVWSDGRLLHEGDPIDVTLGDRRRLRVMLLSPSGTFVNITHDRRTTFVATSPWLVDVSSLGHVHFRRDPDSTGGLEMALTARVTVIFEQLDRGVLGFYDIVYVVADPALKLPEGS